LAISYWQLFLSGFVPAAGMRVRVKNSYKIFLFKEGSWGLKENTVYILTLTRVNYERANKAVVGINEDATSNQ
jgi:hypothetical protein